MSSINPHYTFEYSQPSEYHFSHDSVFLARRVFDYCRDQGVLPRHGLDLGAGCGIIGLDFLFHCQEELLNTPAAFDFLEVQTTYHRHFINNAEKADIKKTRLNFLNENYEILKGSEFAQKYDLILCNPPYFHLGQGKLSPCNFKNRCRFFMDSDLKTLIQAIENCLTFTGNAFVLLRNQTEHGWSAQAEVRRVLSPSYEMEIMADIRGTGVIRIHKALQKRPR